MILFKNSSDLHNYIDSQRKNGTKIGFVPTMGALHQGHISLINYSKAENDLTICSIFVNPTQFNDPVDFKKYPKTIEKDILLLEVAGCDILFLPDLKEVYPDGVKPIEHYELGFLETVFEGKFRKGHFQGVCMVVHRLLDIVKPDKLYLGQKDYQQCMVINKLVELIGMANEISVVICPTLREKDGLAMSSRNSRLNEAEREKACSIFHSMNFIKENITSENILEIKETANKMLTEKGFQVDYIDVVDAINLTQVNKLQEKQQLVILVAAFLNEIRLIDNMLIKSSTLIN